MKIFSFKYYSKYFENFQVFNVKGKLNSKQSAYNIFAMNKE